MTFLDDVLKVKRREVRELRAKPPGFAGGMDSGFARTLRVPGLSVIAEIKRRSPSKGVIAPDLDAARTALAYAKGGAVAISCLTDREFFGAHPDDLQSARTASLPVLRKDFLIDEVQVDESVFMGASAVLLIVRILDDARLKALITYVESRGLHALVEAHDEKEIARALAAGASIVGVNNRDLATLKVDPGCAIRLRPRIPKGVLCVAESGVRTRDDVKRIEDAGFDAVLIGEALATSKDPAARLQELLGKAPEVSK